MRGKTGNWRRRVFWIAVVLEGLCLAALTPLAQTRVQRLRLDQVVPPSVAIGTDGAAITLLGQGFRPGDELLPGSPSVQVLSFAVASPTTATATLRILPDAPPGPVRLDVAGFDQSTARQIPAPPPLLLYPAGGLAGPLAVRDAAIVFPMAGTLLTPGQPIFARGLLSTSGTGTVIGTFLLDGVPFDQFTAVATGGEPLKVEAKVPIPFTYTGTHDLQLQILYPQRFLSGAVRLVGSPDSRTALQLIAPEDRAVVAPAPTLRWTQVPGAARYEVLWAPGGGGDPIAFPATGESWTPNRTELQRMGAGQGRWTVRPVFPGEVEGAAAPWRQLTVLGSALQLSLNAPEPGALPGSVRLRWAGAPEGVLYLLEFYRPGEGGAAVLRALTKRPEYLLRRVPGSGALRVRVTPLSPSGRPLGEPAEGPVATDPSSLMPRGAQVFFAAAPPSLTRTAPADGAVVEETQPPIGATWTGTVSPDDVAVFLDNMDVSAMVSLTPGRFDYTPVMPLEEGSHTVGLTLGGGEFRWSFSIRPASRKAPSPAGAAAEGKAPPEAGAKEGSPPSGSWTANVGGTFTEVSGSRPDEADTFRLTLSSQSDLGREGWFLKDTLDASFRHDFPHPHLTKNESRNWVVEGGFRGGDWGWSAKAGYMSPDFLSESQLVSPGLVRGGAEATVASPAGKLSAYGSFDDTVAGLGSGSGAGEIRVKAASYSLPLPDDRFAVTLLGLWSEQDGTLTARGGSGRVFGVLARLDFAPQFRMILEAAQGRNHPDGEDPYQGNGYRVGFSGTVSGTTYGLDLRRVSSTFANPANPGYTQGGVPDRTGGDLRLGRNFGRLSTSFRFGYQESGVGGRAKGSDGRQTNSTLTLAYPLTEKVSLSGTFNGTWTRQDPDKAHQLPGVEQDLLGVTLSALERFGKLTFSQTYTGQRTRDDLNPLSRNTVSTFVLTLGGGVTENFGVATTSAFTRSWAAAGAGRSDLAVVSVAPYWNLPNLRLTLTPRLSYTRNLNNSGTADSHAEQYQLTLAWNPAWWHSFLFLQGSAEYDRNLDALTPLPVINSHRYTLSLVFHWGGGKGTLHERYAPAPGRPGLSPVTVPGLGMGSGI